MARPINILHVIDTLAAGGAERMLVELVNNLDRRMMNPSVCVTRDGLELANSLKGGVRVYHLNRRSTWDWVGLKQFGRIVKASQIDVIHTHGYSSTCFVTAAKIYNLCSIPVVMHAHSSDRPGKKARLAARLGVNHFIGVAPELINWAHSLLGFSAKETTLLGNSIDPAAYQALPRLDLASYFPFCPSVLGLVVANVRPVKDFDTLFRALGKSKFKDRIGVLVAGSIEDEEYVRHCHNLLSELRLREQVAFLGSRKDVPQLLASVDVGLLSSARESGPVALLEYMASALPFVVTKVGQVGKTASEGKLPGMVPEKNVTAFSAELDQLLSLSEKDRKLRGDNGQRFMLKHFSLKARIDQLQEVYASLADDWRLERGRKGK